jgi:hypothetical protein
MSFDVVLRGTVTQNCGEDGRMRGLEGEAMWSFQQHGYDPSSGTGIDDEGTCEFKYSAGSRTDNRQIPEETSWDVGGPCSDHVLTMF